MSYYNITDEYNEKHIYSLKELINEMIDENFEIYNKDERPERFRYLRDKIISRNGSGVYDHLVKILKFDPLGKVTKDKNETQTTQKDIHCTLKIVKLLYSIEKAKDMPKYYADSNNSTYSSKETEKKAELYKIKLVEIFENPSLENLKTYYSDNTTYGIIFEQLDKAICSLVENVDERNKWWEMNDYIWTWEIENLQIYLLDPDVKPSFQLKELCRIEKYLDDVIINRLSMIPDEVENKHESVAETLYNIISAHTVKCYDADLLKIKQELPESPTTDYIEDFLAITDIDLDANNILQIRKAIYENKLNDELHGKIAKLIVYNIPYTDKNKKCFEFAFKYYKTIIELWNINHEVKIKDSIPAYLFVSIIQELLHIRKNNESVPNKYFGYKYFSSNEKVSLSASIQNPGNAKSIAVMVIINKIENRLIINAGRKELLLKKLNIEKQIYKIKQTIFSYYDYSYMSKVNSFIFLFINRELVSDVWATDLLEEIWLQTKVTLDEKYKDFELFSENEKAKRALLNMCKEVIISHGEFTDLSKLFVKAIIKAFDTEFAINLIRCPIKFTYEDYIKEYNPNGAEQSCYIVFYIDKIRRQFVFRDFYYTFPKDTLDYIKQIGLGSFIENGDIGEEK